MRDHPRSRGVYARTRYRGAGLHGSSPLARGLLGSDDEAWERLRIIPARAGFTRPDRRGHRGRRDHPRSRGVYPDDPPTTGSSPGSSPLARGLPDDSRAPGGGGRIIPARAGFTRGCGPPVPRRRDHPRSRGVYQSLSDLGRLGHGSSPLARGLRRHQDHGGALGGIIPARAGFTLESVSRAGAQMDHPRSRGVYQ